VSSKTREYTSDLSGELVKWVKRTFDVALEIVLRSDDVNGFVVLPKRWVVERTFARFGFYHRLSKEYEQLLIHSQGMVYLASIHRLLRTFYPAH
jgi:putative transposase